MPHVVIECSKSVLQLKSPEELIQKVYETVVATEAFENNVMVRIIPFEHYTVMGDNADFIYICASIMDGRTTAQKKTLSTNVIRVLKELFPTMSKISMTFRQFEKVTFTNNSMI